MKTTWLSDFILKFGLVFEKANPSLFRALAAILPYSTPIPVAWLTMRNAATFLGFAPWVAFIFVFGLEGMGLWFTSMFVDAIVDWIRSRNWKTFAIVFLFGGVVYAYVYLLVSLNVVLDSTSENEVYSRVVTLLCYLPLLTGIGNGYYKLKVESKENQEENIAYEREKEERIRRERSETSLKRTALKKGINVFAQQVQVATPVVEKKKSDWRLLSPDERREVVHVLGVEEIMHKYGIGRSTAFEWKKKEL